MKKYQTMRKIVLLEIEIEAATVASARIIFVHNNKNNQERLNYFLWLK